MIPNSLYIYFGLALTSVFGWSWGIYEHHAYKLYREEVQSTAKIQQVISENTDKWNQKVIKESTDEYQKRLNAISTKYGRMHNYCASPVPNSNTEQDSGATAGKASNDVPVERNLVKDCAVTTNMLVTLQDILKTTKEE